MSSSIRHSIRRNLSNLDDDKDSDLDHKQKDGGQKHKRRNSWSGIRRLKQCDSILEAMDTPTSELAQFLNPNGSSMGTNRAWFYSLALEPMEVRRERIIMMAEAYSIFGALFLNGTWFLYEYGGLSSGSVIVDRLFNAVMTIAIVANIYMAMISSFLWLLSVLFSGSSHNWVYGSRNVMLVCHVLLVVVLYSTTLGVGLGIYCNMVGYWTEMAICMTFFVLVAGASIYETAMLIAKEVPLEYYHFPMWFKLAVIPFPMLTHRGRENIRKNAKVRSLDLKERAVKERQMMGATRKISQKKHSSVYRLLRNAADSIGREDCDVTQFEENLEKDWYNETSQLKKLGVDALSRYMPRRLADEVHQQLNDGVTDDTPLVGETDSFGNNDEFWEHSSKDEDRQPEHLRATQNQCTIS